MVEALGVTLREGEDNVDLQLFIHCNVGGEGYGQTMYLHRPSPGTTD